MSTSFSFCWEKAAWTNVSGCVSRCRDRRWSASAAAKGRPGGHPGIVGAPLRCGLLRPRRSDGVGVEERPVLHDFEDVAQYRPPLVGEWRLGSTRDTHRSQFTRCASAIGSSSALSVPMIQAGPPSTFTSERMLLRLAQDAIDLSRPG